MTNILYIFIFTKDFVKCFNVAIDFILNVFNFAGIYQTKTLVYLIAMNTLLQDYSATRKHTETLCSNLKVEDYTPQSAEFASPPKWHIAHTTWFFEEMILKKYLVDYNEFDAQFSFLFNSYYNSVGERISRNNRGLITRPEIKDVFKYRAYVDDHIEKLLKSDSNKELQDLIILGINHEQQHQELLLTDLKFTFYQNPTYPKYSTSNYVRHCNDEIGWLEMDEGIYKIGYDESGFCFDNEIGKHRVFLESYQISKALVTNAEFIEFIKSDGYKNASLWLDDGWHWVKTNKIKQPLYWNNINGVWHEYTLSGLQPIDDNALLSHISFYEASAFAFWKGCRLPTEFEWEAASNELEWGKRWEWTNSAYLPYPGFKIAKGAVGEYNGKFMINQMVLRGASEATAPGHSRKTYRNFFYPQTQWQYSGLRLAK